jgi:adenylate kinase family enzyme
MLSSREGHKYRSIRDSQMRVAVIGTSGAGKTTLAREIGARLALPHIELDAINWQAGWHDLARHDPAAFSLLVEGALQAEAWVVDGNYGGVRDDVWRRATHLVWLDYDRPVIMARVIRRSLRRVVLRTELWPGTGNRERWHFLFQTSHPILWAWRTWSVFRKETAERLTRAEYDHLVVLRLRRPHETAGVAARLGQIQINPDSSSSWPSLSGPPALPRR